MDSVATIHFSPFTGEWFTDFLFIHGSFPQQEGSFCALTHSLGNHGRMLHSFTLFTRIPSSNHANTICTETIAHENLWTFSRFHFHSDKANNSFPHFRMCFRNEHVEHAQATTAGHKYETNVNSQRFLVAFAS